MKNDALSKALKKIKPAKPCVKIYGVPRSLEFTLFNMHDHLVNGGCVQIVFNCDGDYMMVRKMGRQ